MDTTTLADPFELTETQQMIRDTVRDFARKNLAPRAEELDRKGEFPMQNFKEMAELGLTGIPVPEEYGGAGADILSQILAVEEIGKVCGSTALTLAAHTSLGTMPIVEFGNEDQKRKYVPPAARGEVIASYGLTEPQAGSDSAATATTATKVAGGWKLQGTKMFMTNASVAGMYVVTAVTDKDAEKHRRISAFILDRGMKGISVAKKEDKLGVRASDTCIVNFDDVTVPDANLLGDRGQGFTYFMKILDGGRIGIGALALGLAEGGYERAVQYARERRAFDKPIGMHQAVAFKIADMAVQIQASRHLIYHAARLKDAGRPYKREASMAKLYASEMAMRVLREAIQVLGGYGYMTEYQVERNYRDAKLCEIGEGTSEIQRIVISRDILGKLS
ncbi:MAG TPA: acyl-CoA dehydrogenase family protein [Planctomycetota bacterium]|nr:acyl-CoA dehydrogenase family protein [Planctomycetota bacterium]